MKEEVIKPYTVYMFENHITKIKEHLGIKKSHIAIQRVLVDFVNALNGVEKK